MYTVPIFPHFPVDRYRRAEAGLEAVAHTEDDDVYDRALARHSAVLARLLRAPAPDLAAVSRKLDLIIRHSVFESSFGESCLASLQRDVRGFAALASGLGTLGGTVTSDCPK